ncbi:hypothetical protein D030_0950A, partial [Vibrio parahaemolyticus AQ3810]
MTLLNAFNKMTQILF